MFPAPPAERGPTPGPPPPSLEVSASQPGARGHLLKRTKNIGVISKELANENGCSGPVSRASGIDFDIRKNSPYECYEELDLTIPLGKNGDEYDRTIVRIRENMTSLKIVEQIIDGFHSGDL